MYDKKGGGQNMKPSVTSFMDELYNALDWLLEKQEKIEKHLALKHLQFGRHRNQYTSKVAQMRFIFKIATPFQEFK